jgi:hypothetical protein
LRHGLLTSPKRTSVENLSTLSLRFSRRPQGAAIRKRRVSRRTKMSRREFVIGPPLVLHPVADIFDYRPHEIRSAQARDVSAVNFGGRVRRKPNGLLKASKTEIRKPRSQESSFTTGVQTPQIKLCLTGGQPPTVSRVVSLCSELLHNLVGQQIDGGLTVRGYEGVHIDQPTQPAWRALRDACYDHPRIAVADECPSSDDLRQFVGLR